MTGRHSSSLPTDIHHVLCASRCQIRYHEAFLNNSKLCVIMEYAPFGDLRYYISKGQRLKAPFPEEAIWRIFLQLCR